jgi:hypothetical protein
MTSKKNHTHKTPSETIRLYCRYCVQSRSDLEVENCTGHIVYATGKPCPFYEYRLGKKRPSVKVMRQFCLDCMGSNKADVKECAIDDCLIHPYRFCKNPALARKGKSPDEMAQINALRRPLVKGNPVYFEQSSWLETNE